MSRMRKALPIALLLACSGCGLTSSPADNLTFQPPSGWSASPGIMGFMQFWKSPSSDSQVLMLFKSPKEIDKKDVFSSAKLDEGDETRQTINICGNQTAEYVTARATSTDESKKKTESEVQMVMTNTNGTTYLAMYVYPVGARPDPQAAAAIRELCPKPQ